MNVRDPKVSYIHFLSKIFSTIKWSSGFFNFHVRIYEPLIPFSDRIMTWKIEELKINYNKRTKIEELTKFLASKTN